MCACVRVIVSLPHASCTMLRSRNAVVTSAEYSRTRLRSRISYEIPRAHIPRATSRQLSLRESFCDESLLRVIARFPLARQSVPYVSLDRVVYTWFGREDTREPFDTGFRDRDSRQWTLARHAQGYAHGTRTRMSFAMSRSRNANVLNAQDNASCAPQ